MKRAEKIVLIVTDSQRADMLGCYGNDGMRTPNIDRLSRQGVRFDKAYCCQPVSGPARSAILTGAFPHSNGSWGTAMPLGETVKTLGQRMSDNGFDCAFIGKWQLDGGDYFGMGRAPEGWDADCWYDMRTYLEELADKDRPRARKTETNRDGVDEAFTYGHRCTEKAIQFLSKRYEDKFLLVLSYDEPHHPYLCPQKFADWYKDYEFPKKKNVWDKLEGKPAHQKVWAGESLSEDKEALAIKNPDYFGCNSFVDAEIGRFMQALDKFAPDALVIYTSTNGEMLGSHSLQGSGPAAYEELAKVPFIVRWNGFAPENAVCRHPVSHIDIAPTIIESAGFQVPRVCDGKSLYIALKEPEVKTNQEVFIEFGRVCADVDGFGGFQPMRAVTDGRYKLVVNLLTSDELYDLESDPAEMNNLIDSADLVQTRNSLHDKLLNWMNATRDPFRGYVWAARPWRQDAKPSSWAVSDVRQREDEDYEPRQLDYNTGLEAQVAKKK